MTKIIEPGSPITKLPSLAIIPKGINLAAGNFNGFPQLTDEQIEELDLDNLIEGIVFYNTTFNVAQMYAKGRWNNINSSLTYKGEGYDIGSPFALPAGDAATIETNGTNNDPGVVYLDHGNGVDDPQIPRIFINDAWTSLAVGGGSSTFENITVTNTIDTDILNANTINVDELDATHITVENIDVSNTLTTVIANISTANITTAIIDNATIDNLHVTQDLVVDGVGTIGTIRAGINNGGNHTPGTIAGLSGPLDDAGITFVLGSAAGVGATATIEGSPLAGIFRLTTGTGIADFIIADFTLPSYLWEEYSASFGVIWQHADPLTYDDGFTAKISAFPTQKGTSALSPGKFRVVTGGVAQLSDSTNYQWNYMVIGNVKSGL